MSAALWQLVLEVSLIGLAAGLVYGIFGGGSGLFLMPGFYFLSQHFPVAQNYEMQVALASTCMASAILGIMPTIMQYKKQHIQFQVIRKLRWGLLLGSLLAVVLLNFIPSHFLKHLFGIVVLIVAVWFWLYQQDKDKRIWHLTSSKNFFLTTILGLLWFSLGVSVFIVPYLHKCGIDMRKAIGSGTLLNTVFSFTTAVLLIFSGLPHLGASWHHVGYVNITLVLIVAVPSIIGAIVGAKMSWVLPQKHLKKVYAGLVFIVGCIMIG